MSFGFFFLGVVHTITRNEAAFYVIMRVKGKQ